MRILEDGEREDRRHGHAVALRLGGSMTGAGIGAGVLYLIGSDTVLTAPVTATMLLLGIPLLVAGHRARRRDRR